MVNVKVIRLIKQQTSGERGRAIWSLTAAPEASVWSQRK